MTGGPTGSDLASTRPAGERFVQSLLDEEERAGRRVPAALRAVGDTEPDLTEVSVARYTDPRVHELEVERIWKKVWQVACREEDIASVGDVAVYDVADLSLLVVRTGTDEIRAFHNSCRHRGTRLRSSPGTVGELRCPFHGFTWNLDGSFAHMPSAWDFTHLDPEQLRLPEAAVGTWGGFVFVNPDPACVPLGQYLEVLPAHFASWPLEERVAVAHVGRVVPCNWKVALEAFIESYHTVAVHPQLLGTSGDTQTEYDVYAGVRHVNRMITPVGVSSGHLDAPLDDDAILRAMFLTREEDVVVPEGSTARAVLAARVREELGRRTNRDWTSITDCEALDAIEYFVFPNFVPWAGFTTPLAYRFRPDGDDHTAARMDVWLLEPFAADRPRPAPAPARLLGPDERWADANELGYLGRILDQDTATLGRVQRGLAASARPGINLARYQESRIRHFHQTLTSYLGGDA